MGNGRNQDNWHVTIENIVNFDDGIAFIVDLTNRDFTDILAYLFGLSGPISNLPPGIIVAYFGQSHGNKSNFLFTSLLTLL